MSLLLRLACAMLLLTLCLALVPGCNGNKEAGIDSTKFHGTPPPFFNNPPK